MARYTPKSPSDKHFAELLKRSKLRATEARIALMRTLSGVDDPLSTNEITRRLSPDIDPATTYRNLKKLAALGIIRRVDFHHDHAHFELHTDHHHHHAICTACGTTEDIEQCTIEALQKLITPKLSLFAKIDTHSLEFFGVCNACRKK